MKEKDFVIKIKKKYLLISMAILVVIVLGVKFLPKNIGDSNSKDNLNSNTFDVIVLNDQRCKECAQVSSIVSQLEGLFSDLSFGEIDYMSEEGKKLYEETNVKFLPAILFNNESIKQEGNYSQVESYLEQKGDFLSLKIGSNFDPKGEICDNEMDDDNNGKTDCDDESCKINSACMETICNDNIDDDGDGLVDCDDLDCEKSWQCMPKTDKPEVELFVMSHCPYGTQIEKGMLPAARLLGDKIDFNIRFCSYAMHGEKELDEQTLQYCIQKEYNDKYLDYLACFLKDDKTDECLKEVELDGKLDTCIAETDAEFKITEKFNDKSTWSGGRFPLFDVDKELNEKYGISGSPNLVINGVTAKSGRDSASLLDAICTGFNVKPAECNEELSSANPSAGFGFEESSSPSTDAQC